MTRSDLIIRIFFLWFQDSEWKFCNAWNAATEYIAAVSVLNRDFPNVIGMKPLSIANFTSLELKSPSGPIITITSLSP